MVQSQVSFGPFDNIDTGRGSFLHLLFTRPPPVTLRIWHSHIVPCTGAAVVFCGCPVFVGCGTHGRSQVPRNYITP